MLAHFWCKTRENPILSQGSSPILDCRTATNSQLTTLYSELATSIAAFKDGPVLDRFTATQLASTKSESDFNLPMSETLNFSN